MAFINVKFCFIIVIITYSLFITDAIHCNKSTNNDPLDKKLDEDLDKIFDDPELKDIFKAYLNVIPSSHKTRLHANRILGLPKINNIATIKGLDNVPSQSNCACLKEILNSIFEPFRDEEFVCKKKCKPCDQELKVQCEPNCPCVNYCKTCPTLAPCNPAIEPKDCPKKPTCAPCSPTTTTPTTSAPSNATPNTTSSTTTREPIEATTIRAFIDLSKIVSINRLTTIEPEAKCNCSTAKPCPLTYPSHHGSIDIMEHGKRFHNGAAEMLFSSLIKKLDTPRQMFDFDRNLKILVKNSTKIDLINKMIDEIPNTNNRLEIELSREILNRFGYYNTLNGTSDKLFKRKLCDCMICKPKVEKQCIPCKRPHKECPTNERPPGCLNKCPERDCLTKSCPTYLPCPKCNSNNKSNDDNNNNNDNNYYSSNDEADDDGDESDLDEVDEVDVVKPGELDRAVPCKGYTCKFQKSCGKAVLNPLTPKTSLSGYIVGGEDSIYGEWPSHVRIKITLRGTSMVGICSGVLISDRHILTAAHCASFDNVKLRPDEYDIILGDYDTEKKDSYEKHLSVSSSCIARNFVDNNSETTRYDVAVLELSKSVTFNDYIQPACLSYKPLPLVKSTKCFVVGAGITKYNQFGKHEFSKVVQKMAVKRTSCKKWGIRHDDRSRHCFTKAKGQGDSCGGDSGGPILCLSKDKPKVWTVAGLVSYGSIACDGTEDEGWVGVYTRVPALLKNLQQDCGI